MVTLFIDFSTVLNLFDPILEFMDILVSTPVLPGLLNIRYEVLSTCIDSTAKHIVRVPELGSPQGNVLQAKGSHGLATQSLPL